MRLNESFWQQVDQLMNITLFRQYNPECHMECKHFNVTDTQLKQRLKDDTLDNSIGIVSAFDISLRQTLQLIVHGLHTPYCQQLLEKWEPEKEKRIGLDYHAGFPIGHGFARNTFWSYSFEMSNICIVLTVPPQRSDLSERTFQVLTAYPWPDLDEMDQIIDAQNEYRAWAGRRKKKV